MRGGGGGGGETSERVEKEKGRREGRGRGGGVKGMEFRKGELGGALKMHRYQHFT